MRTNKVGLIVFCLLFSAHAAVAQNKKFSDSMKEIFGKQYKDYQWLDYPLDNFGVGTAYRDTKETINPKKFLCATFTCLEINPIPSEGTQLQQWLRVARTNGPEDKGFADFGCGGPAEDALKKKSSLALSAFFPKLLSVVGITADFKKEKAGDTSIAITSACGRLLTGKMTTYVSGLQQDDNGLKAAMNAGQLVLVKGDVVITSLEITVKSTSNLKADLEAKLLGVAAKKFGDDAKLGVQVSKDSDNNYHLKTTSPVIVGVLAVRQPKPALGVVSGGVVPPLERWKNFQIPLPPNQ